MQIWIVPNKGMNSLISDWSENINADEGFAQKVNSKTTEVNHARINYLPLNKPFNRGDYNKPKSMVIPENRYSYLHMRRNRAGFSGKIYQK